MSLLADPGGYATAFERYADCIVSILLWCRRMTVRNHEHAFEMTDRARNISNCGCIAEYSRFFRWLTHAPLSFVQKLLSLFGPHEDGPHATPEWKFPTPWAKKQGQFGHARTLSCSMVEM